MSGDYPVHPGVVTSGPPDKNERTDLFKLHERQIKRAYKMGLLHGINAQSMAQVKNDVMEFDDFEWEVDD
jgi:hypothetical protein